jgi:isopentenyl-diphosphate delta-isomerase
MPDESREDAIVRRVQHELGMTIKSIKQIVPDYIYKTPPYNGIIEYEYCPIYTAIATSEPVLNPEEVDYYKWVKWQWFIEQTAQDGNDYSNPFASDAPVWSWWCKDQQRYFETSQLPL